MSSTLKRKPSPSEDESLAESSKRRFTENTTNDTASQDNDQTSTAASSAAPTPTSATDSTTSTCQADRLARFAALRNRNKSSRDDNRKATTLEVSRASADPAALASLSRRKERASEKLLHAQTLEDGEDWDRKRAWDWTAEESAAWDKKLAKKKAHRDNVAFQDYSQDANKIYKRQVREMNPDVSNYEAEKMAAVERAAQSGGLEIVETEDGELIAVDKDGSFYSTKDSTEFVGNKPSKEKIDKLVGEIQKAEEVRLKKRRERSGKEEDGDVTYINDKNKQVGQAARKKMWRSMLTKSDHSSTKSWRDSTTNIPRRSGIASREVLLSEPSCHSQHLASTLLPYTTTGKVLEEEDTRMKTRQKGVHSLQWKPQWSARSLCEYAVMPRACHLFFSNIYPFFFLFCFRMSFETWGSSFF